MNKGFLDFASDFEKQNIFKIVCSMAVCYIFVNLVIYFADTFFCTGVQPYMTAHHFLNYHFGIIPRALYGATIGELTQVLPKAAYFLVWFLICVIPYVVYFCVYLRMRKSSRNVNTLDAVAFFALVLPTTFMPLNDFFRLDIVLLNWFVLCALVIWNRHWLRYGVPFIMIIMTLTHEGAIFMFLPTLCGIAFYKAEKKMDLFYPVLLCFFVLCSLGTYLYLSRTVVDPDVIDAFIQKRNTMGELLAGELTMKDHLESMHEGYLKYTLTKGFTPVVCMKILFSIPFFAAAASIVLYIWRALYNSNHERMFRWKLIFLFFTTLSNICLLIGCDYNRWAWSWLSGNVLLLFLLLGDENIRPFAPVNMKYKRFFFITLFIFYISGTGDCQGFSRFSNLCGHAAGITVVKIYHAIF